MEPKIKAELSEDGDIQYTIPAEIMDRNHAELFYTSFRDVDTQDYIYQVSLNLTPKEADEN